jgi:hypothetical protein
MAGEAEKETVGVARWLVTIGTMALYFVGGHVPLPGVDAQALGGEAGRRLSLFALGATPIISGLVVLEIARLAIPPFARWAAKGPRQAQLYARVARGLALGFAAFQALGVAATLEGVDFAVDDPGWSFRLEILVTLVGASAFLMWLIDTINSRGVGDGLVLLFASPFVASFPTTATRWWQAARVGAIGAYAPVSLVALAVVGVTALVAVSRRGAPGGALDLWSPLLGGLLLQMAMVVVALVGLAAGDHGPLTAKEMSVAEIVGIGLALAALIFVAALRRANVDESASAAVSLPRLGVEVAVCCAGLLIAQTLHVLDAAAGYALIVCVAAALSVLPPWRGGRALAPG